MLFQPPVRLDSPAIDALYETIDALLGYRGKSMVSPEVSRYRFRRLVVEEPRRNLFPQGSAVHDLHALILRVFPADVRLMMRFLRVVASPRAVAMQFVPNGRDGPTEGRRDVRKGIFLFP